jgi:hypothetical protein
MKSIWNLLFRGERIPMGAPGVEVHIEDLFYCQVYLEEEFRIRHKPWVVVCVCSTTQIPTVDSFCGVSKGLLVLDGMEP